MLAQLGMVVSLDQHLHTEAMEDLHLLLFTIVLRLIGMVSHKKSIITIFGQKIFLANTMLVQFLGENETALCEKNRTNLFL